MLSRKQSDQTEFKGLTWKILIPVVIGLAVIFILFRKDFTSDSFSQIRITWHSAIGLLFALLAFAAREGGMALRFNILTMGKLNLRKSIYTTFLCEFTSAITPSSVGGSALSMIFMGREGISYGRATTYTLIILFEDNLFFTLFCPLILLLVNFRELFNLSAGRIDTGLETLFWIAYGCMAALTILLGLGIFFIPKGLRKALLWIFSFRWLQKWKPKVVELTDNMVQASIDAKNMNMAWWVKSFCATCLSWCGRFLVVNAIFYAIVPAADQSMIFFRQFIVWALLMFTPTPGGSGVSEWLFDKYYFDLIPSGGMVVVLALLWRVFTYYVYLIVGVILLPSFFKRKHHDNIPERQN